MTVFEDKLRARPVWNLIANGKGAPAVTLWPKERDAVADAIEALRDARTWLVRPSDVPSQHAETLIRATHRIDEALARLDAT